MLVTGYVSELAQITLLSLRPPIGYCLSTSDLQPVSKCIKRPVKNYRALTDSSLFVI